MAKLQWDTVGTKLYETGVSRGVLYVTDGLGGYETGVPWNGLTSVSENPSGAEATAIYADNNKYLSLMSAEEFACTIEAYTYPDAFAECDGTVEAVIGVNLGQQPRKGFGFCYRTEIGDDTLGIAKGYRIHVVYNCKAAPSARAYQTINESPEAMTFSWEVSTTPVEVAGHKPTAVVTIDSTKIGATELAKVEALLYGDDATGVSTLPTISALIAAATKAA